MTKKYTIVTYGCQMNEHDSEKMSWILENMGYKPQIIKKIVILSFIIHVL